MSAMNMGLTAEYSRHTMQQGGANPVVTQTVSPGSPPPIVNPPVPSRIFGQLVHAVHLIEGVIVAETPGRGLHKWNGAAWVPTRIA